MLPLTGESLSPLLTRESFSLSSFFFLWRCPARHSPGSHSQELFLPSSFAVPGLLKRVGQTFSSHRLAAQLLDVGFLVLLFCILPLLLFLLLLFSTACRVGWHPSMLASASCVVSPLSLWMPESFAPVRPNQIGFPGFGRLLSQLLEGAQVHQVWACAFLIALFLAKVSSHEGGLCPQAYLRRASLCVPVSSTWASASPASSVTPATLPAHLHCTSKYELSSLTSHTPLSKSAKGTWWDFTTSPLSKARDASSTLLPRSGGSSRAAAGLGLPTPAGAGRPPAHPPLSTLAFFRSGSNPCCRISQFLCLLFWPFDLWSQRPPHCG